MVLILYPCSLPLCYILYIITRFAFFFSSAYFIFERESENTEGQRERDKGFKSGSALRVESPMWGLNSPTMR